MATEMLTTRSLGGLKVTRVEQRSTFLNMLVYGDSGIGKTTFAGSADALPEMRSVLVVDIEGGTESLRRSYPDVDVVRVTTWKEMQTVYSELHRGSHEYRTVILDSLTEIQKFNMYQIMADLLAKKGDSNNVDPDVPSMREWGKNLEQIRRYVRNFRDLQMHTIFTALAKEDKDQRSGVRTIKPSLSGKMADEVAAFLDLVMYYYMKEVPSEEGEGVVQKRLLLTQKTSMHVAKDRSGMLPMVIEDPTMTKLFTLMNAQAKEA